MAKPTSDEPSGRLDRSVYVKRRIAVLLGLLAIVAAIVLIIVKPGSASTVTETQDVKVPSDLTTKPVEPNKDGSEAVEACSTSQLAVVPITDQTSYAAGELPLISLSVENSGKAACIADLGTGGITFTISSGDDNVWRSADCQSKPDSRPVILDPKKKIETETIEWDRTRSSAETCDIERDPVVGGGASYHLRATAGGAKSEDSAQFLLY